MRTLARSIFSGLAALATLVATPTLAATAVTGSAGGGQAFSNYQPSLVLNQLVQAQGVYPCRGCGYGAGAVMGMVRSFGWNFGMAGAPQAQGQIQSIAQNTALFSILGTTYGGDGRTTFALPNLAGRTPIGVGTGPGLPTVDLGGVYGSETTTLSLAQLPAHLHGLPTGGTTSVTGGSQPIDNTQPSLGLNYMIQVAGIFPAQGMQVDGGGGNVVAGTAFLGEIGLFAGNFEPGWMMADGRLLQIAENDALFAILGTTYGGDGQTTFALPDLRGRSIVGAGQGPGLGNVQLGQQIGSATTTLTSAQMPAHDHDLAGGGSTNVAGGSQPLDQHQPGLGLNYLISLQGIFPNRDSGLADEIYLGEVIAFAGTYAPKGFAFAAGQLLPINQNQALFALLGTQFGGDGIRTFALPDLRGRVMLGSGSGFDVGLRLGTETTTLLEANLPAHTHTYSVPDGGVPEPASWAMMLIGFGMAGGAIRRRAILAKAA